MASFNSNAPILDTYQAVVSAYTEFLTVAIHTILFERNIYPEDSFIRARKYNYPVRQNRHPRLCNWIMDAVAAVEVEMLKCTVAQTSVIIHAPPPTSQPLERFIFSTADFPRIPASETLTRFSASPADAPSFSNKNSDEASAKPTNDTPDPATIKRFNPPPTSDLPEQFRATLVRLTTSLGRLKPLPEDCSFTLAIELRDDEDVYAPLRREGAWIAAEPGLQRERRRGDGVGFADHDAMGVEEGSLGGTGRSRKGKDLGGVRTTPVRSLEAGAFKMEVWVEEGRGKFQVEIEDGDEDKDEA